MTDPYTPTTEEVQKFWSKVEKTEGCWHWRGRTYWDGYGRFHAAGRDHRAHRFAYEAEVGPIDDESVIDHLCRVRGCVRPDHLEPVTNRENLLRGVGVAAQAAAKTHCPKGHPYQGENLSARADGNRTCRACHREREALRRSRGADKRPCDHCGKVRAQMNRHIASMHPGVSR